jgi:hypothetical protein
MNWEPYRTVQGGGKRPVTDTSDEMQAQKQQALSPRQNDVLEQALRLLVEGGDRALTTASIARAANCSKESLYKWFGDRDGLLTAMVRWQASKVRVVPLTREKLDAESLFSSLEHFARDWLLVLSGKTSIALNRLAVSHAASGKSTLGDIVLANGPVPWPSASSPFSIWGRRHVCWPSTISMRHFARFSGLSSGTCKYGCCLATIWN